ncbi:MAG TPA: class I SAM-dependent methyltransferase, partial [Bryobacteraceae bacterium]|nr:class I SAM-dependent methyltransferase [Bryobacteraceae bacterium]
MIRLGNWPLPEELQKYYPASYWFDGSSNVAGQLEQAYRRLVLRDHVSFIRKALARIEPGPVLDVGCGGGLLPRLLRQLGFRAIGLDLSQKAAALAWQSNEVPVVCADLSNVPFPQGGFAAVTMFHVLEHLYDPAAYLQAAHKLLRPGGTLIVQVPNAASWQFLLFGDRWNGLDVPRHLVNYRSRD